MIGNPKVLTSKSTIEVNLQLQESISSHGITWRFDNIVEVGQFVNGDYYIVGPVTIISISPEPVDGRNGSVLNLPSDQNRSGFDDRVSADRYDPTLCVELPLHMEPGDALISSISVQSVGELPSAFRPSEPSISPVQSVSVLTCIERAVAPTAFRPSYCDRDQKIYYADSIHWNLLPQLQKVPNIPDLEILADHFQRPWLEVCFFSFDAAAEYQSQYGRETGRAAGMVTLALMLDFTSEEKERLLINFMQYGIDLWGIIRAGYPGWQAHGGHGSGRKWPIIFTGIILGDSQMQSPQTLYPKLYFGEDMQTMYDSCWTGANVVYAGHIGPDGNDFRPGWGPYEHLYPSQWESKIGEDYRRCCTSIAWVGQALAARIMGAKDLWNHDAFFDYVDRWMYEDDSAHIVEIQNATGWNYSMSWARQGQTWDTFINNMWSNYRSEFTNIEKFESNSKEFDYFHLKNYPNPGNPSTLISYKLFNRGKTKLIISDLLGREIRTLIEEKQEIGEYLVQWDGLNNADQSVSSGIYLCTLISGNLIKNIKIILLR